MNEPNVNTISKFKTKTRFSKLSWSQKLSVFSLVLLAITLPMAIILVSNPIRPILTPASGPVTPSNTPTPVIVGNQPVISTDNLPSARVGKNYRARIEGYDLDNSDKLTVNSNNVPTELNLKNCKQSTRNSRIAGKKVSYVSCDLTGIPTSKGIYEIMIILEDSLNRTVKYLTLEVN